MVGKTKLYNKNDRYFPGPAQLSYHTPYEPMYRVKKNAHKQYSCELETKPIRMRSRASVYIYKVLKCEILAAEHVLRSPYVRRDTWRNPLFYDRVRVMTTKRHG